MARMLIWYCVGSGRAAGALRRFCLVPLPVELEGKAGAGATPLTGGGSILGCRRWRKAASIRPSLRGSEVPLPIKKGATVEEAGGSGDQEELGVQEASGVQEEPGADVCSLPWSVMLRRASFLEKGLG